MTNRGSWHGWSCSEFTWQEYTDQIQLVDEVFLEFGATSTPKKTSLYDGWRSVPPGQIKSLKTQIGRLLVES